MTNSVRKKILENLQSSRVGGETYVAPDSPLVYKTDSRLLEVGTKYKYEIYLKINSHAYAGSEVELSTVKEVVVKTIMKELYGDIQNKLHKLCYDIEWSNQTRAELAGQVKELLCDIGGDV